MAIMAGTVFFLARFFFAAIPGLVLRYPVKKWAAIIAALGALGYLLISGSAFATVRSYLMITVMFFAVLVDRPALALRNVALAAIVLLLLFPESALDPGFQMSFTAVTALVSAYEVVRRVSARSRFVTYGLLTKGLMFFVGVVGSTFVAGLAVAPIAAYRFHTTQHFAVLANVVAMPVANIIVMPAALLPLVVMPLGLEAVPLVIMGFGVDLMTHIARLVAGLPGAIAHVVAMLDMAIVVMALGMLWLMLWQRPWRLLGLRIIAIGLSLTPLATKPDIIVGNDGDDVLVRTPEGMLAALRDRKASFEARRWLEHDGHPVRGRKAKLPIHPDARCDGLGCTVNFKGLLIAKSEHGAALREDCRAADILILDRPRPRGCDTPKAIVDFFDARYEGSHTLSISDDGRVDVQTVAKSRGTRPWAVALPGRRPWPESALSRKPTAD